MVWKFSSDAAREKQLVRFARIEPELHKPEALRMQPQVDDVPLLHLSQKIEVQNILPVQLPHEPETTRLRPAFAAEPLVFDLELAPVSDQDMLPNYLPSSRKLLPELRLTTPPAKEKRLLDIPRHPLAVSELYLESGKLSEMAEILDEFYVQAPEPPEDLFEGLGVDVTTIPPPPPHPGHQHSTKNTFGHALRLPADDERQSLWVEQRAERGFDDTELWSLDDTFSRFILPRLKAQRKQKLEPPVATMPIEQWLLTYDRIIRAFELLLPEGGGSWSRGTLTTRERSELQEGLDLFRKYFFALTW